jgi:hypothetical protein
MPLCAAPLADFLCAAGAQGRILKAGTIGFPMVADRLDLLSTRIE